MFWKADRCRGCVCVMEGEYYVMEGEYVPERQMCAIGGDLSCKEGGICHERLVCVWKAFF